jgi:uncharacterized protein YjbI with pentapeptide repeats
MKVLKWIKKHPSLAIIGALIMIASLWAAYLLYLRLFKNRDWAAWTGLAAYTAPDGTYYPTKGVWNFLELLIIPVFIGVGAAWFNWQQTIREQNLAQDRQREDALQSYLDKMAELLLDQQLLEKKDSEDDPVIDVAQIRTVTTLRILDRDRRNILLQFLHDANLTSFILKGVVLSQADLEGAILHTIDLTKSDLSKANLREANLRGAILSKAILREAILSRAILREVNLEGANLSGANLKEAILSDAKLREVILGGAYLKEAHLDWADLAGAQLFRADLCRANLRVADLSRANLRGADLNEANLREADLNGADLSGADLSGADLSGADLRGATGLTDEQLSTVKSLKGATMPDGTIHE